MQSNLLSTSVDSLVVHIKDNEGISLTDLKAKFNLPIQLLERWLTVLEEYDIVEVHYQGFEGYVSLGRAEKKKAALSQIDIDQLKSIFIEKAKVRGILYEEMKHLWPEFLTKYLPEIKTIFKNKAKKRGYADEKINLAWVKFEKELRLF